MKSFTLTSAICFAGATVAVVGLAAPARHTTLAENRRRPADLIIESFAYSSVSVPPRSTVTIVNHDATAHTVTADDSSFDVFAYPDASTTFTAPAAPGTYTFSCTIHPSMTGTLIVT